MTLRVLVVDDNADARNSVATLLDLCGYEVRVAASDREALEVAESFQPHAVISEVILRDSSGLRLAQQVKRRLPAALLVALTTQGDAWSRVRAREAGFEHHLMKGDEPVKLLGVLAGASQA